jgi:hypothetical protein
MEIKFGKHWMIDLYLCQNKIWEIPETLMGEIERIFNSVEPVAIQWSICKRAHTHDNPEPE